MVYPHNTILKKKKNNTNGIAVMVVLSGGAVKCVGFAQRLIKHKEVILTTGLPRLI